MADAPVLDDPRPANRPPFPDSPLGGAKPLRGDPINGERYFDRDFAAAEWAQMWQRVWHVAGRMAQLEEPGDFIVHDFLKQSVLVIRQHDGSVRAFHNTCRHRGNRLAAVEQGGVIDGVRCAYHGWLYGLDGMVRAAQDPDDFPQGSPCGKIGLKEVACEVWGGFVWYSFASQPRPLLDYLAPIPDLFASRNLDELVRVVWLTVRVNTNWKFSPDNFNESYHLPTVHPQMRQMIDEDYTNTRFDMFPNGHNRMIEQGQPSLRADFPNMVEPVWEMMLEQWGLEPAAFQGRSRDGRKALQQAKRALGPDRGCSYFDDLHDDELTDYFHHTVFPNVTITGTPDGVHFFRTEPDAADPEWCTFDYWYLAPRIAGETEVPTVYGMRPYEEAEHEFRTYGDSNGGHLLGDFIDQDLSVAVAQQVGFHSLGYEDPYLSGQESRVRRFHEVLNDYLEGRR
ncbi:aromatic ring-hydroxylating oxygenase subunit alpha [Novosphingobium lentum]|uniref:aromatic ring-hydroxylating oxygenase subunit alpha n=1 Tax=Novosphingobium lentum TaxID=145287 RepID=UPI0008314987|nr:aromatic ring-hydroxylating dioxygenase subunit alpha [Novosphingobium lentum]